MDPRDTQNSFIPKQVLTTDYRREVPTIGLFLLTSILILVVSILFLGGSYVYAYYLKSAIERPCGENNLTSTLNCGLEEKLKRVRDNLQENVIEDLKRKDAKIRTAEVLLKKHLTVLPIFELIEDYTLKTISYDSLEFLGDELTLSGEAKSYESVALQSDIFSTEVREIDSFLFSNLAPDLLGRVSFSLMIKLKPGGLSYQDYLDL